MSEAATAKAKHARGDCWILTRNLRKDGYGRVTVNGKRMLAHRWALSVKCGYIPEDLMCCHRCSNPSCVNPDHLYWGDHKSNGRDMIDNGTDWHFVGKGEDNPRAKLSEEVVLEIRKDPLNKSRGYATRKARQLGVGSTAVYDIIHGRSWKHVCN